MGISPWIPVFFLTTLCEVKTFWDIGTTTLATISKDITPRQSFFRWEWTYSSRLSFWFTNWDWEGITRSKRLCMVAGLSIDMIPLGTGVILNRRVVITAANLLEPYQNRQRDLRIWALGRTGLHTTPYRYRVWRTRRLFPRSDNPEHWHGPRGVHVARHDISIVHSFDQIYIYYTMPDRFLYAYRANLCSKHYILGHHLWYAGSGYQDLEHIYENYKIHYALNTKDDIVDCSRYLPKWWGKFICIRNIKNYSGIPNGGGLFVDHTLVGIGCFEIRYNEDRIGVFTDLRYYYDFINMYANLSYGEYYEYAYPEWSIVLGWFYDGHSNYPYIPTWQKQKDHFPLGK